MGTNVLKMILSLAYCFSSKHNPKFRCVICTGVTRFTLVLHLNCTASSQKNRKFLMYIINKWVARAIWAFLKNLQEQIKDVRAHCYCASLVRTLFIGHARVTSFSSARTDSKTQQNIERMTFALTWCANIFVGCSVTPTFFSADHFLFWLFSSC